MKKHLIWILLVCFSLSGCSGEKMVKVSSFSSQEALVGEGMVFGFGPLDPKEEISLFLENKGTERAELVINYEDGRKGEVLCKEISLADNEKRMIRLKALDDSLGNSAAYIVRVTSKNDSRVFGRGDSYLPEGVNYFLRDDFSQEREAEKDVIYDEKYADKIETMAISSQEKVVKLPFVLEDKVTHFAIRYESNRSTDFKMGLYRARDHMEFFSSEGNNRLGVFMENNLTLENQNEDFYLLLEDKKGQPLEGILTKSLFYKKGA